MQKPKKIEASSPKEIPRPVPVRIDRHTVLISKIKRRLLKHVWLLRSLVFVGLIGVIGVTIFFTTLAFKKTSLSFYFGLAQNFIFTPQEKIKSANTTTNILILGKGGAGHEAPDLTDTIIFMSINLKDPSVLMVSLPRDIWIPDLRAKLNSVYYWGNRKKEGGGLILTKSVVEEILGQPIHYALIVDFSGFQKIIDAVDGIDITIERSFTDNRYPIAGREDDTCDSDPEYNCRYETVTFIEGKEHMDGERTLKFVRSRNAEGDEGTDLARGARQEKVISALKGKVLSRRILFSPKKLLALKDVVLENIETDIDPEAAVVLARKFMDAKSASRSLVLSERFLDRPPYSRKYDNLYVFIPKKDDWSEVHDWITCELAFGECD